MSFNKAFAAARKSGKKTFTWNGKSYTTELKGEAKTSLAPKTSPRPPAPGKRGAAAGRVAVAKIEKDRKKDKVPTSSPRPKPRTNVTVNVSKRPAPRPAKKDAMTGYRAGDITTTPLSVAELRKRAALAISKSRKK